jgi:hypothetical protein
VLLHALSQAKNLEFGARDDTVCLHLKSSCSSSPCFRRHVYIEDLI